MAQLLALGAGAGCASLHCTSALAQGSSSSDTGAAAADVRTQLVLLGTRGGPGVDASRAQTASAVLVAGRPYLVDCGYGALRQLVAAHVPYLAIGTCFLTHLHDDHTADLAALLSLQWTNGRSSPTDVYGPYGTAALVSGALAPTRRSARSTRAAASIRRRCSTAMTSPPAMRRCASSPMIA
jgi:ribonuclease BN (tRNA processing enzyme)